MIVVKPILNLSGSVLGSFLACMSQAFYRFVCSQVGSNYLVPGCFCSEQGNFSGHSSASTCLASFILSSVAD